MLNLFCPEKKVYAECPEGFTHMYRAALRFRVSVPDIAWRVIEGEVASAGVVAGKRGLASVLVCVQFVKNIVGRIKKKKQI